MTAWRYVEEMLGVLAAWVPGPHEGLVGLGEGDFVIVDVSLIPADRAGSDGPPCSMRRRCHGMNVQVVAGPDGALLWFSRALPG